MAKLLVILALCIATSLAQTTYPLVCSGLQDNSRLYSISYFDIFGSNSYVTYSFQRGTQAFSAYANTGGLPAATCTWLDRGIGSAEPARLKFVVPESPVGNTQFYISKVGDGFTPITSNVVVRALIGLAPGAPGLPLGQTVRKTFNAYNNGNGEFIITGLYSVQY